MERFNLKKLKEIDSKGQYCVEVSNTFGALEFLTQEWKLIVPGKRSEGIKEFQAKRVYVILN
jgi:hypothetical protein